LRALDQPRARSATLSSASVPLLHCTVQAASAALTAKPRKGSLRAARGRLPRHFFPALRSGQRLAGAKRARWPISRSETRRKMENGKRPSSSIWRPLARLFELANFSSLASSVARQDLEPPRTFASSIATRDSLPSSGRPDSLRRSRRQEVCAPFGLPDDCLWPSLCSSVCTRKAARRFGRQQLAGSCVWQLCCLGAATKQA